MNNKLHILLCITMLCNVLNTCFSQQVRWPYKVSGSNEGRGQKWQTHHGYFKGAACAKNESEDGKPPKPVKKYKPAVLKFYYQAFDANQLCVLENYNPGAIVKIEVKHKSKENQKTQITTIFEGEAKAKPKKFTPNHFFFEEMIGITEVYVHMDYLAVDGVNQILGPVLCNMSDPYKQQKNLPDFEIFEDKLVYMNDDVNGKISPKGLDISADGKTLYFSVSVLNTDQLYEGHIGPSGKIEKVVESKFNLPYDVSTASGLLAVSEDGKTAYVTDMGTKEFNVYKVFQNKRGTWKYKKQKVPGYKMSPDKNTYLDFKMNYEGNVIIVSYVKKGQEKSYGHDLFVSKRTALGGWSSFKRMSDDVNTVHKEKICYLAPDNRTMFFGSTGHIGYGSMDLFMSQRLDDTWQNWTYPVNLGPIANSDKYENNIVFDTYNNYAYITRDNNIYRISLKSPELDTVKPKLVVSDPTILVRGTVYDKSTKKPVESTIKVYDIVSKEVVSLIETDEKGEYQTIFKNKIHYAFEAIAKDYLSESYSFSIPELKKSRVIEQDFELQPIEKGTKIVLNNIFFETAKYDLKPISFAELDKLVDILSKNPTLKIEISGHTDNVGNAAYNKTLSDNRAKSVVEYIVSKGIDQARLTHKGYGLENPVASNETEEGRALNRRVEMKIVEK
jgi:OmpA-OmpF porin, OOP family